MIDLHSHLLPGLDDGPRDLVGSVALADAAAATGVRIMLTTPHLRPDFPAVRAEELRGRTAELHTVIQSHGIPLQILPGAEISWHSLPLDDDALRAASLGGNDRDLLLESPWERVGNDFDEAVGDLMSRGFRVTLAHPERSSTFQHDVARFDRLLEAGALVQVNASSLTGPRASAARRFAWRLLKGRRAHVMASDAHAVDWRPPDLADGVAAADRALPELAREIDWMVTAAPLAIVEGRELPARPQQEGQPTGLSRLRRWL